MITDIDLTLAKFADMLCGNAGKILTPLFRAITCLGDAGWFFIAVALLLLLFRHTRKAGAVAIVAIFFGFLLTNVALKHIVARERPFADEASVFYEYWLNAGKLPEDGYSFPSGHATVSAAFCVALFLNGNKKFSWLLLFVPLLVGFTRIYFEVHFATDVLAGLLVGTLSGELSVLLVLKLKDRGIVKRFLHAKGIDDLLTRKKKENRA